MNRAGLWFRRAAVLAAVLSIAVVGARTFWHLNGETAIGAAPVTTPAPAVAAPEIDIAPVLAFAPFGERPAAAPPPAAAATPLPDLRLYGVMVDPGRGASRALIGHEGRTQSFSVGDTVADVAMLADVRDTSVVLDFDGTERILDFETFRSVAAEDGAAPSDPLDRLGAAISTDPRPPLVPEPSDARPETTEELIGFWRDRISRNPKQVLDAVGFVQVDNGYQVAPEHDRGVALAGLLEGDVIKSVNGRTIGNVVADRKLFDEVVASGVARVEIEREGRVISMSFPIK